MTYSRSLKLNMEQNNFPRQLEFFDNSTDRIGRPDLYIKSTTSCSHFKNRFKERLLQIKKTLMTRQATWKLVPSLPVVKLLYTGTIFLKTYLNRFILNFSENDSVMLFLSFFLEASRISFSVIEESKEFN